MATEKLVTTEYAGQRIDNYLLRELKGIPRSRIYRAIRGGEVRVNKGRISANYKLLAEDMVRIPPLRQAAPSDTPKINQEDFAWLKDAVLFEDDSLLIIYKPSGMAVHGGTRQNYGLIEAMRVARPELHYIELIHRLDRDTSGCLMLAKKRSMLRKMHELLRMNNVEKRYLTLVKGQWKGGARNVDAPLNKFERRSGERHVVVDADGKPALTRFIPQQQFSNACLMEAVLKTGRTHQIRVHALHCGHPVAMDERYGDKTFNQTLRSEGLKRMFLHAAKLSFIHPNNDERIVVEAPLPHDLADLLSRL